VIGQRLARARARIRARGCTTGRVRRARSRRASGIVLRQSPRAGARKPFGARVSLVVSRGRRR
jgi:beta-lactam-binding protein with PASTA domain